MKNLKLLPILLLLLSFTACKKDKNSAPVEEDPFNITKYVMVGKTIYTHLATSATTGPILPFIVTFEPQSRSRTVFLSRDYDYTFTYKNKVIVIGNGTNIYQRYIVDENKLTVHRENNLSETYQLVKIPTTNQFDGNTYSGGWLPYNTLISYLSTLKFSDTQYGEATLNEPIVDKNYILIKNIAAVYKTGEYDHVLVHINGKLEVSKCKAGGMPLTGTFIKR